MMNILITGGTGFLGKELVKQLKTKKHKLFIISRTKKAENNVFENTRLINADLIHNQKKLEKIIADNKIEVVYHLAASSDETLFYKNLYKINVGGTKNILLASIKNKKYVKLFIHISTSGVLGSNMGTMEKPANETFKCIPETNYEKTKYLAEQFVIKHKKQIPIVIIRPTIIYGPNNNWKKIIKQAKKRFPLIGDGKNIWHFVYVKDVASALVLVLNNKKAIGNIYLIAGPDYKTYEETYKIICMHLKINPPKFQIPIWFANLIAFFCETGSKIIGTKSIINRSHIGRILRTRVFDCTKAKNDLSYVGKYNIDKALKETIKDLNYAK
ncbi:MAG: hypothetical protein B6U87_03140 [Candidatus Aenigmarchaeota archaeon ex4484_52]|nr:MAG: hypothetical protein B6U87_03140 [Candidatus Aenigmarchaeota archaeon ex4484_52]